MSRSVFREKWTDPTRRYDLTDDAYAQRCFSILWLTPVMQPREIHCAHSKTLGQGLSGFKSDGMVDVWPALGTLASVPVSEV